MSDEQPAPKRRKGRKPASLTPRSVEELQDRGYRRIDVVERWNPFARVKNDLWGIADILALRAGEVLAVQVTSRSNMAARRQKIADHEVTPILRSANVRIEIHGWDKGPDNRWRVKVEDLS